MTEEQFELAKKLLREAEGYFCDNDTSPSVDWFKNLYLLDGSHMFLTKEGWNDGSYKGDFQPDDILDEVNAPTQQWIPLATVIAADKALQKAPETHTPPDSIPSESSGATLPLPDHEKVTTDDCNCKKGVSRE